MKKIWITGGSSGIGFATAKKFLENNWTVIISSSNINKLNSAKERMAVTIKVENLHVVKCDISKKDEVDKTVSFIESKIGKIDIAILNAGAAIYISGLAPDLHLGIQKAISVIDEGHAMAKLNELVKESN